MLNSKINNSNEIIIFKQYLSAKAFKVLFQFLIFFTFIFFIINNEIISKKFYEKYKIKELEIRNNLKLGSPIQNEFHIDEILSIFFEKKKDNTFYDIEAIIYDQNQFIISDSVIIELSKSNFNLVFFNGERLILNEIEKSKTVFDKFTYTLESKKYEELLMDKDHYNTLELILHPQKDFRNHGYNKILNYFILLIVSLISLKIIFLYRNKKNNFLDFSFIFILILIVQILNSYFIYLLNNSNSFNVIHYFSVNLIILTSTILISNKILK